METSYETSSGRLLFKSALEKIEKEKQLIEKKMNQAEMQFGLDQSLVGNEA
ncbi:14701_t:CDS:2 [Funneliformis caledonium]|uniref:14701_t:CDS:1 n=1 Tax=Funneliformis caledonium TaxID=1117310 RepID=A0A9N9FIU8_9GLOM|nr:14701_t:CDS:2 [Funneliformis caledonium]